MRLPPFRGISHRGDSSMRSHRRGSNLRERIKHTCGKAFAEERLVLLLSLGAVVTILIFSFERFTTS